MSLRRVLSTCALGVTLAFLAGCSSDSNAPTAVNPTDPSAPAAPVTIGTHVDISNSTDVLSWQASASGNVAGYDVYMYSPDPTRDNSYVLLGQTRGGITEFSLPIAEPGTVQYFRVKAFTLDGTRSAASATVNSTRTDFERGGSGRGPGQGRHEGE